MLLMKSFPLCRMSINCWSKALLMAFCLGVLLVIMERASEGADRGTLWVMSLSSAGDGTCSFGGDEDEEAIVYMRGMKGMIRLVSRGCSGCLFIGLDK